MTDKTPSAGTSAALTGLRDAALEAAAASAVPYSKLPAGAALLLSDGSWVAGARLESATFPLTIPALQAAYVSAISAGRHDIVAAAMAGTVEPGAWVWLAAAIASDPVHETSDAVSFADPLPEIGSRRPVSLPDPLPTSDGEGIALARAVAGQAFAPISNFPVGCVLTYETVDGKAHLVPGVNVEHSDWTRGLCAERSAIAAATSLGPGIVRRAYLSTPNDPAGTPCGACRQILAETMPDAALVIDRGSEQPERVTPRDLLPHFFSGDRLRR